MTQQFIEKQKNEACSPNWFCVFPTTMTISLLGCRDIFSKSFPMCHLSKENCLWKFNDSHVSWWWEITEQNVLTSVWSVGRVNFNCWKINSVLIAPLERLKQWLYDADNYCGFSYRRNRLFLGQIIVLFPAIYMMMSIKIPSLSCSLSLSKTTTTRTKWNKLGTCTKESFPIRLPTATPREAQVWVSRQNLSVPPLSRFSSDIVIS